VLSKKEIKHLSALALNLGLDILFEIHYEEELEKIVPAINIVGINNRNLNNFEVSMDNSRKLIDHLPQNCIKVAESGLRSHNDVNQLFKVGYDAFLIGENFMRSNDPGLTASQFMKDLNSGFLCL
jgi:indole-3-glycerol phosphate synthase